MGAHPTSVASPNPGAAKDATPMKSMRIQTSSLRPGSISAPPGALLLLLLPFPKPNRRNDDCRRCNDRGRCDWCAVPAKPYCF